jgi:hypothetical protein
MLQASGLERFALDALALGEDHLGTAEVDIGRGEIVEAPMVAGIVTVLDEGSDLPFEIARQKVVVEAAHDLLPFSGRPVAALDPVVRALVRPLIGL